MPDEPKPNEGGKETGVTPELFEAVTKDLEALKGQVAGAADRETELHQTIRSLVANRTPAEIDAGAPAAADAGGLALDDLPDPIENPEGFRKGLGQRVEGMVTAGVAAATAQLRGSIDTTQRLNGLWANFKEANPDLTAYSDLAEIVAREKVTAGIARGVTAEQIMFGDEAGFIKSVADGVTERIGTIREGFIEDKKPDPDPTPATERPDPMVATPVAAAPAGGTGEDKSSAPATDEANRTGGIPGGSQSANTKAAEPTVPTGPGSMVGEMKKSQADMGLV